MKRMFAGVFGALLVCGLAAAAATPVAAQPYGEEYEGGYSGSGRCNCNGPVTQVVNAGTQYVTTRRVINTQSVVPHVRVVDHTRVVLHRRTIVHRQIIVHRHATIDRNITVNRMNTAHRFVTVNRNEVRNVNENSRRSTHEQRTVRGRDCNCGPGQANYRGGASYGGEGRYIRSRY